MNRFALITCCLLTLCFQSYNNKKSNYSRLLRSFQNKAIEIPDTMLLYKNGRFNLAAVPSGPKYILYFSDEECAPCVVKNLDSYSSITQLTDSLGIPSMIIISPPAEEIRDILLLIKEYSTQAPIWIDHEQLFKIRNPHIPLDRVMHKFYLNADYIPVVVGDIRMPIIKDLILGDESRQ